MIYLRGYFILGKLSHLILMNQKIWGKNIDQFNEYLDEFRSLANSLNEKAPNDNEELLSMITKFSDQISPPQIKKDMYDFGNLLYQFPKTNDFKTERFILLASKFNAKDSAIKFLASFNDLGINTVLSWHGYKDQKQASNYDLAHFLKDFSPEIEDLIAPETR